MDLINQLAGTLGIDAGTAQALAGGILGQVKGQLTDNEGTEAAGELEGALPEMGDWAGKAASLLGEGGVSDLLGGGGLLGAAASALGGDAGNAAKLIGLVSKLGLDADTVIKVAPIVLQFLGERLSPDLLAKVQGLIPGLSTSTGDDSDNSGGGVADMIGGLFG